MPPLAKPYELTFQERSDYLYVRVASETITEEIAWEYLREITKRCSETNCTRLLLHRDIPETLEEGLQLYMAFNIQNMMPGVKMAVVNTYLSNEATLSFSVEIGRKHGADFALFNNDTDAEKWLLQDPSQ